MSTPEPARVIAPVARPLPRSVAPPWHTVLMTLLVMGPLIQAKLYDLRHPGATLQGPPAPQIYIIGAIVQCIFCLFAWWSLRLGHVSLKGHWRTLEYVARCRTRCQHRVSLLGLLVHRPEYRKNSANCSRGQ